MEIEIIPERCIACGLCQTKAPDIFDYHDDGIVKFLLSDALTASCQMSDGLSDAVKSCPTAAIRMLK